MKQEKQNIETANRNNNDCNLSPKITASKDNPEIIKSGEEGDSFP
ncbi:hypothetical protein SynRS9902_01217 [Synechococcus sp. RS9902]|nr:hypothetical protein SynRS9902_01217 [Synechococcus sp. RS9902]